MLTKKWTDGMEALTSNQRIVRRTIFPLLTIGTILLSGGIIGAWKVHELQRRGNDILANNVPSIRAAEELEAIVAEIRYRLKRFLSTNNERHFEEIAKLLPEGRSWLRTIEEYSRTEREQYLSGRINRAYERLVLDFNHIRSGPSRAEQNALAQYLAEELVPLRMVELTKAYISLNEEELVKSNEKNTASANQLMFGLLLLGTCSGVTGLLAGYFIAQRLSRIIIQLSLPIRNAAGKLDQVDTPISISSDPGFQDLESMMQSISDRVTGVVERLQEKERDVLRAEQLAAVGQLAAGMAHELRNPLTTLKAILQLADTSDQITDRDLEILKQEIERLESSIQSFLDFARPPQPEKKLIDWGQLITNLIPLVSRKAERKRVHIETEIPSEPVIILADSPQMRQVALNLILNALDAIEFEGNIRISLTVFNSDSNPAKAEPWAELCVSDDGPGLPEDLGDQIFSPFVSTKESGMGLGLSICKRIVESHNGYVIARQSPYGGAVLLVQLPLAFAETIKPVPQKNFHAITSR